MADPTVRLTEMEREILEECAGLRPARPWGAAVGACLEYLRAKGLISSSGIATRAGIQFLVGERSQ